MLIVSTFQGALVGKYRFLLFAIYQDYLEQEKGFGHECSWVLERLARNLGGHAAVVQPFPGDVDRTRGDVLFKEWTPAQQRLLSQTPALLVINTDFDKFNPQRDSWALLHLRGDSAVARTSRVDQLQEVLGEIVRIASTDDALSDMVALAQALRREPTRGSHVFEAKPGMFGFSVDLMALGTGFATWAATHVRPSGYLASDPK